jgi:site-specific recombinase XerD
VVASGRKGALAAFRDATFFKACYAWGLRRREAVRLDLCDLHPSAAAPQFGTFAALHVRWGKASRGSPPKRRTVLSVFDWAVECLREYVERVRPDFDCGAHPVVWVTERRGRVSMRHVNERFARYRDELGLPGELVLHCLRHSYITHLAEAGYPERFVQDQVGHSHSSTTAIYTSAPYHHGTPRWPGSSAGSQSTSTRSTTPISASSCAPTPAGSCCAATALPDAAPSSPRAP